MFLSHFKADAGGPDRSPASYWWFMPISRTQAGVSVTASDALTYSAVFACVKVISESFAVMPFYLRRRESPTSENMTDASGHWLYRLLAKRPNRFQNPVEFKLMLQGHLTLRQNAFCQITDDGRGGIAELLPLHPDRMSIETLEGGDYRYKYNAEDGRTIYYTRGEIWHLRGLSDDGMMGLAPYEVAKESIGEGLAMQAYSARMYANDARPGGWIEHPGRFKDEETKRKWRDSYQRMQGGANRGKVAVLEGGMKFHEVGLKNSDAQFIESRGLKTSEICRIFRVPPHKIGDLTRATHSNIEAQNIEFWTDTMLPVAEIWEASIRYSLLGQGLDLGPDELLEPSFDMDRMMRGDSAARSAYYSSRTQWGSITPNEVRRREGDQPLPWLNFTMHPVNMARADESGVHLMQGAQQTGSPPPADSREANVRMAAAALSTRVRNVIAGNARRMARRIAGGQATSAAVLAEAMGIEEADAEALLARGHEGMTEDQIAAELAELAFEG